MVAVIWDLYLVVMNQKNNLKLSRKGANCAFLLNAQLIEAVHAGHFRTEDGYTMFPQLFQILQTLVNADLS